MQCLMIDTSGADGCVALFQEGDEPINVLPVEQSQSILAAIDTLLSGKSIDCIAIGVGPGAFTGTRVGVMTAKTLAFAKQLPIVPFCSLKRYTPNECGPFILCRDAKSMGTFVLKGTRTSESVCFEAPYVTKETLPPSRETNFPFLKQYILNKFLANPNIPIKEIEVFYFKIS